MNLDVLHATTRGSLEGTMTFPEVVQALLKVGVESYSIDLVQNKKTHQMPDGKFQVEDFEYRGPAPAREFSKEKLVAAIRASQQRQISFKEFLKLALEAGVTDYTVYLQGKKAIYFGRDGDLHIENFPSPK